METCQQVQGLYKLLNAYSFKYYAPTSWLLSFFFRRRGGGDIEVGILTVASVKFWLVLIGSNKFSDRLG